MKKVLLLMALIIAVLAFTACADTPAAPVAPAVTEDVAEPPAEEPAEETPADVVETNDEEAEPAAPSALQMDRIVLGTNAGFPPFEFIADAGQGRFGQYSGIDIAIGMRIAERLGAELVIHDAEFAGLIMELNAGTIDFIAAAMTIRPDRKEHVHFSTPYFTAMQYIVVPYADTTITSVEDLAGARIGVQLGTTGEFFVQDYVDYEDLLSYSLIAQGFMEMRRGGLDAIVVDSVVAMMFVNQHPDELRIIRDNDAFASEHYGIAVRHEDTDLLAVINEVLEEMLSGGEIDALFGYYSERLNQAE
ncbi:MAG: transporter substrate-binding domain-containing protein [Defluviitaleaceae bacterium]|nr:transporter substrate-binding domain-containing protein [Defluviitaleaceae bacterium]MCL2262003.1 transporter substrate-binding domain-containing protein [Defluviitaleaceae bacterium]